MSDDPGLPIPLDQTLDGVLGIETLEVGAERARSRARVTTGLMQPFGIVHGGTYAAIAESITSQATARAVQHEGNTAMGMSNQTSYIRPITEGYVHANARSIHRGRTTWIWEVEMCDDDERLCAVSRITLAVRPIPAR